MKFSAGMIVLNGMPFVPYILKNLYPVMDEIIIVEGAVELAAQFATPEGHSRDETVAAIKNFPDPERKIKLIQKQGFWSEKLEMSQAYGQVAKGDYLWQVDVDEFYHAKEVRFLQNYLCQHPEIEAVALNWYAFYHGFNSYVRGGKEGINGEEVWRIFRWKPGYQWVDHRPPTVINQTGLDTREIGHLRGWQHRVRIYHYSYVFPAQVEWKIVYYEKQGMYQWRNVQPTDWYKNHYLHYTPYRVHIHRRPMSWLEPFRGEHPPEIYELMQNSPNENRVLSSWRWRVWQTLGRIDVLLWRFWNRQIRPLLRPLVRLIRARFLGYDYSVPSPPPRKWDYR